MTCKWGILHEVSSWRSTLGYIRHLGVMRGSKHRLVGEALGALYLILWTRLHIRVLLIIRLVSTRAPHGRLELAVLRTTLCGWDKRLLLHGSWHKGTCDSGWQRGSAAGICTGQLLRLELLYVIQVEVCGIVWCRILLKTTCRRMLQLLVLLLILHI